MKSILQVETDKCYLCRQKKKLDMHHIMNGPFRAKSEEWGGYVYLCRDCHRATHDKPKQARELKQIYQETFEILYGKELWMKTFKKNYL